MGKMDGFKIIEDRRITLSYYNDKNMYHGCRNLPKQIRSMNNDMSHTNNNPLEANYFFNEKIILSNGYY